MAVRPGHRATLHCAAVLAASAVYYTLFFSPALLAGKLLALHDGLLSGWPSYTAPVTLWTDLIFGGFPAGASTPLQSWYPVARLLGVIPGSWNAYMISAYVLASAFTYGYVYSLTRSRLAAAVAGLTFGMSGFMIGHLPHKSIIHTVAWLPLMIWSVHELRRDGNPVWLVVGAAAVALSALAGHTQLFVYSLVLTAAYAVVLGLANGIARMRYFACVVAVIVLGLALAAVQLIPSFELSSQSTRWRIDYEMFSTVSMPPRQTLTLLFPYAYGGDPSSPYRTQYFGADNNQTEYAGYVGLLPLVLAASGIFAHRRHRVAWFWAAVCVVAVCLAWGINSPLGRMLYHVPVYNKFRAPSRHLVEFALAASVLSGLGVAAILRPDGDRKTLKRVLFAAVAIVGLALVGLVGVIQHSEVGEHLRTSGSDETLLTHPAVFVPLLVLLGSAAALVLWFARPHEGWRAVVLVTALVGDLGTFGFFNEWRYHLPRLDELTALPHVTRYRERLEKSGQRLLTERGAGGSLAEFPHNLSRAWGVRTVGGYSQLMLQRVGAFFPMDVYGKVREPWAAPVNRAVDLMAVRYIVRPGGRLADTTEIQRSPSHWLEVERIGDDAVIYENLRAMPQAWMVASVVRAEPRAVLEAVHTSRMAGGGTYDPRAVALAEPPFPRARREFDPEASVRIIHRRPMQVELRTEGRSRSFLVLSDVYYPGWEARVDGHRTRVFRVNYIQRGIVVPPGKHDVRFEFKPFSFYAGLATTAAAVLLSAVLLLYASRVGRLSRRDGRKPAVELQGTG